jgi:hypothetical protein
VNKGMRPATESTRQDRLDARMKSDFGRFTSRVSPIMEIFWGRT